MSIDQIAPEALKLPAQDRAMLAATPWQSLEDPFEFAIGRTDDEAINLAIDRDTEIESGAAVPLSHKELMSRLRR